MFKQLKEEMLKAFNKLIKDQDSLFTIDLDKELLWNTYLDSFPNEEEKQHHNCNCCKSFIRKYGNIVAIKDGELKSIWNFNTSIDLYKPVIDAMQELISGKEIASVFVSKDSTLGTPVSKENGYVIWNHFSLDLPRTFVSNSNKSEDTLRSIYLGNRDAFKRGLEDLTTDALETVLGKIKANELYLGDQYKADITKFLKYKKEYDNTSDKEMYIWLAAKNVPYSISRLRTGVIGTLLQDISGGMNLDKAIDRYNEKTNPTRYKRAQEKIKSKKQVENANKKLKELGLEDSLGRRLATGEDVSIQDMIFVDPDTKKNEMGIIGEYFDISSEIEVNPKSLKGIKEISIDDFVNNIARNITSMEVMFESHHLNNLAAMITAKVKDAKPLPKWGNHLTWCYSNAVTDSIKERVKAAGGKVDVELRCSLSWLNHDDLDIHVIEPNGNRIYYSRKSSNTSGKLDVDMNMSTSDLRRNAVENVIWDNPNRMLEGEYEVIVHNYTKRQSTDSGFEVEIECRGHKFNFGNNKNPGNDKEIKIVKFNYSKKDGIKFKSNVKSSSVSKTKWGITTNQFHKVRYFMDSPNYWVDNPSGNHHYFFIIEAVKCDEKLRGFFNEFLPDELKPEKSVFEVLAGKMDVEPADKELSGLGFSTTKRSNIIVRVKGSINGTYKVNF